MSHFLSLPDCRYCHDDERWCQYCSPSPREIIKQKHFIRNWNKQADKALEAFSIRQSELDIIHKERYEANLRANQEMQARREADKTC